jgi:molybdopterin-guanine dinucleotide biosynthesis protein A
LAGGHSRRFGRDKAAVTMAGVTLLERAVGLVAALLDDVRVAVRRDQMHEPLRRRFALIGDIGSDIGPAAGLLAAHQASPAAAWLVLACDMPRVTVPLLARLIEARDSRRGATAYRSAGDGLPEPLCAIYEPVTLRRLQEQTGAGASSSLRRLLVAADPVLLTAPGADALASINVPGDIDSL